MTLGCGSVWRGARANWRWNAPGSASWPSWKRTTARCWRSTSGCCACSPPSSDCTCRCQFPSESLSEARMPPKTLALIAHDGKKAEMVAFALAHTEVLQRYNLVATNTTGSLLGEHTNLKVRRLLSGPQGGDARSPRSSGVAGGVVAAFSLPRPARQASARPRHPRVAAHLQRAQCAPGDQPGLGNLHHLHRRPVSPRSRRPNFLIIMSDEHATPVQQRPWPSAGADAKYGAPGRAGRHLRKRLLQLAAVHALAHVLHDRALSFTIRTPGTTPVPCARTR